jgi:putative transcriptional regulator
MSSFQGHFLVAAPHQLDPNFAEAVVLVGGHTERAAFGIIVNGCLGERRFFQQGHAKRIFPGRAALFVGGPVTGPLMAVHTEAALGERRLLRGVYFSAKEKNVLALMRRSVRPCKIFTGYAGWGPGQLDYEVEQGVWRVVLATPGQIFSGDADLWQQLSRQASRLQLRSMFHLKHFPADPLLN